MKKCVSGNLILLLLVFVGMDCFAQNTDARVSALQGEWSMIFAQSGDDIADLTKPPYNELEMIWKFEGNNFFIVGIDSTNERENYVVSGTFTIVGSSLVTTVNGQSEAMSYSFHDNTLTVTDQRGPILTFRKL